MKMAANIWILCFYGILCFGTLAQCTEDEDKIQKNLKKDITSEQSTIYRIKRLDNEDKFDIQKENQVNPELQPLQQQNKGAKPHKQIQTPEQKEKLKPVPIHEHEHEQKVNQNPLPIANKTANNIGNKQLKQTRRTKKEKNFTKSPHGQNRKLLSQLGFTKVKAPNSHNRKRLAVESRRHASPDDSHMFIIKLPPNHHYYSNPNANHINDHTKNSIMPSNRKLHHEMKKSHQTEVLDTNGKKVSFEFPSNGRPGRIYHWNLPIIKKILDDKQRFSNIPEATKRQLTDIKNIPTWSKSWENEAMEKSYSRNKSHYKKSLKRKSPSYYAPINSVNKNSFNKYFAGNGKPKGFYVIKENQKKPLYYKNIIS